MRKFNCLVIVLFISVNMFGQELKISGTVVDQSTGEPLVGAAIKDVDSGTVVITDFDGNFSLTASKTGRKQLSVSYISYEETKLNCILLENGENTSLNIKLKRAGKETSKHNFLAKESKAESVS